MRTPSIILAAFLATPTIADERRLTFREDSHGTFHEAILRVPEEPNGVGVLLIGGGLAWDEHWTVPGSYEQDGVVTRLTSDGRPTTDADTIGRALEAAGFVVMQPSSIRADDELHAKNPAMAMPMGCAQTVDVARAALHALREQGEVDPDRVVIVGHSLGATRACHIADDGVIGLGFLAGAYLSPTGRRSSEVAREALDARAGLDADGDGVASSDELQAFNREMGETLSVEEIDRDGNGTIAGWELAAYDRAAAIDATGVDPLVTAQRRPHADLPWAWDIITATDAPILAIFGGLDTISLHGPMLETLDGERVEVVYVADRGHQLSVEEDRLIKPIDEGVVERIAAWAAVITGRP